MDLRFAGGAWIDRIRHREFFRAPVIETGAGNCHIFVDESGDFDMADEIVINAKTQRPSVCNAAEKLLVHEQDCGRICSSNRKEAAGCWSGSAG